MSNADLRVTPADIKRYVHHLAGTDDPLRVRSELLKLKRELNSIRRRGDPVAAAAMARRILSVNQ